MRDRLSNQLFALVIILLASWHATTVQADSKVFIDEGSVEALARLREHSSHADDLLDKAAGVLVFPDVVKMGFGVGGQYGEGVLLVDDKAVAYYATAGASFGLQLGVQKKTEVVLFMTDKSLAKFRQSRGWKVGVDGSVALFKLGAGNTIDTTNIKAPVIGFIFSNKGLMYSLSMEGGKFTRIAR